MDSYEIDEINDQTKDLKVEGSMTQEQDANILKVHLDGPYSTEAELDVSYQGLSTNQNKLETFNSFIMEQAKPLSQQPFDDEKAQKAEYTSLARICRKYSDTS